LSLFSKYIELLQDRAELKWKMKLAIEREKRLYKDKISNLTLEMEMEARAGIKQVVSRKTKIMLR